MCQNCAHLDAYYAQNADVRRDDVLKLMEWSNMQPHLPQIDEFQAFVFLHSCYSSNEAAKLTIDNYFTARTHCPELFSNLNPLSDELNAISKAVMIVPFPKQTPEGYSILYFRILDTNSSTFVYSATMKQFDMTCSMIRREQGPAKGFLMLIDMTDFSLAHILRVHVVVLKKYMFYLQEALPVRLKGLHFLNAVAIVDKLVALVKPFMKKDLLSMFHVHQANTDSLYDFVPKSCLPDFLNGTVGNLNDLHQTYLKRLREHGDFFASEEKLVVDESQRPGKPKNVSELFGVEGTFKKLDID